MMPHLFAVEMLGITKRFRDTLANNNITLRVRTGTIHAIVGENGAGKSTLMKILYGMIQPDAGTIFLRGKECSINSSSSAIRHGIAMVHQHFMLIPTLTVLENIILGSEPTTTFGRLDKAQARERIQELSGAFHLPVDLESLVGSLSVGMQQRVEILKVLYREGEVVIFDEPTAVLTPLEIESLFVTLDSLRSKGKTILIITHKLGEIMSISDEITVLLAGNVVLETPTHETTQESLSSAIVGHQLVRGDLERSAVGTRSLLNVEALSLVEQSREFLRNLSFTLHAGEILGIAGVEGSGQSSLVDLLTGLHSPTAGSIRFALPSTEKNSTSSVAHVPEDRQTRGLVLDFSVAQNLILGREREFSSWMRFDVARIREFVANSISSYHLSPPSPDLPARHLSGGNQQKLVLAREFSKETDVIIAQQPTRGLDIGAIDVVHSMLMRERNKGRGILLLSSDLAELLTLSDRIAVMYSGTIVAILPSSEWSERGLGAAMTGILRQSA